MLLAELVSVLWFVNLARGVADSQDFLWQTLRVCPRDLEQSDGEPRHHDHARAATQKRRVQWDGHHRRRFRQLTKAISASDPLEMNPSKAQRVCHNGHGAKTHRNRRDHRAQKESEERVEYARRDRYAQSIVYKSKE